MENIKLTPKRKEIVSLMKFDSLDSVLRYYPYRYDIYKQTTLSMSLHEKKVTFEGKIISNVKTERISNGRTKTTFTIVNKSDMVKVIIFNKMIISKFLSEGTNLVVSGKYNAFKNEIAVSNYFLGTLDNQEKIVPVYSLPSTIKDATYRQFVNYIYEQTIKNNSIVDTIPNEFIKKYRLVSLKEALLYIHKPESSEQLHQANRYLKYEEFLTFCVMGSLKRKMLSLSHGIKCKKIDYEYVKKFIYTLPFKLTSDQKIVIKEILDDMNSSVTMSRLLQGDVGSGKTIVAIIALIANYKSNFQGSIMAPTDILAKQHFESIKKFLINTSIKVSLLVSDMTSKEKKEALENIALGKTDIIVGTHALIQENVSYKNLGLAIIDEQHRFGVKQRVALKEKGTQIDVLYMSATPIPRTLASTIYMDMDVSTIEAYPYKERIINTKYIQTNSISKLKSDIEKYLKTNQKIYVVCPSIEQSILDVSNVNDIHQKWQEIFKDYNVGLLHGKLNGDEKNQVMNDFVNGKYQVLVSTTVIEVGINVFDANMMVIYNAERFGLAQIHQLRGRIARDGNIGYCYLLSDSDDEEVKDRLSFIASTNDGFKISEYDLKRRGAGDMLGLAQSGKSPFLIANLIDDFNILKAASKDAIEIINDINKYQVFVNKIKKIIHNSEKYVD